MGSSGAASGGGASVSDTAYAASWDAVTTIAPSKNAVYDKIEAALNGTVNTVAATGATETLDVGAFGTHDLTVDADCTLTFSNIPTVCTVIVRLSGDGVAARLVTFPGSFVVPVKADDVRRQVVCFTKDAGTTWDYYVGRERNTPDWIVEANTQTDSHTLILADAGRTVDLNKATAVNLTVPLNLTVAFPVGTVIEIAQLGAGQVTVVPAVGVTINPAGTLKLVGQYSVASLRKTATDTWLLSGQITA